MMLRSWKDLGISIDAKLGHRNDPLYARCVLIAYVAMSFCSLGFLIHHGYYNGLPHPTHGVWGRQRV